VHKFYDKIVDLDLKKDILIPNKLVSSDFFRKMGDSKKTVFEFSFHFHVFILKIIS